MLAKGKLVKVGVDLDGVVARHAMYGLWVYLRKLKEFLLKKSRSSNYYYPFTAIERLGWKIINSLRKPFKGKSENLKPLLKKNRLELYLITSRFKFLEKITFSWLKKHKLDFLFRMVILNTDNQNPLTFKLKVIKKLKIDCFVDDDYEVIKYLKGKVDRKLFWVNTHYSSCSIKKHKSVFVCRDFTQALCKIIKYFRKIT